MSKTIKGQFNTRLLKEVSETPTCNTTLLYHTEVIWLSKRKLLSKYMPCWLLMVIFKEHDFQNFKPI